MAFRWKSFLIFAAVILGVNLILYINARLIILQSYLRLEESNAILDMKRVQGVLQDDLSHLGLTVHNLARSEEAYTFMTGARQFAFLSRFAAPNHLHLDTHLMVFVDSEGKIQQGRFFDPESRKGYPLPPTITTTLSELPFLWNHSSHASRFEGLVIFPEGPMMTASSPISAPGQPSQVIGTLIMGSFLEMHHVNLLSEISHLSLTVQPAQKNEGLHYQPDFPLPLASSPISLEARDEKTLIGRIHLVDVFGAPAKVLQAEIPRRIYRQGVATIRYFMTWSLGLSIAFGLLAFMIQSRLALMRDRRQESENLFRCLVEQAPDAFFLYDLQRGFIDVNRCACDALQFSREEFGGRQWSLLGSEMARFNQQWRQLEPGAQLVQQGMLQRKDGSIFPAEISVTRFEAHGRRLLLALARDVSERLQNELSLRESEQRFRKLSQEFQVLLDGISDSIILLSPELRVVWGNKAASTLVNMTEQEILGRQCGSLWHVQQDECADCPARRSFETGQVSENLDRTADGRVWEVKTFPLKDRDDSVTGVIRFASDITEKVRLHEENLRTGRLAALGELSAGVAHEINNPNGLILMSMPTLRDAFADALPILDAHWQRQGQLQLGGVDYALMREEIPELFEEMTDGARRIKRIVEDLKNFALCEESDKGFFFDVNDAVQTALRLVSNPLAKATTSCIHEFAADPLPVQGISQRIEQVLVNLILNACQSLASSECRIWVKTYCDEAVRQAVVEVQDEGVGIAAEHLPHITDPFFTTRRQEGGTGLGLSVSSRIVREHGGSLEFSSTPGQGTRVVLRLALCDQEIDC